MNIGIIGGGASGMILASKLKNINVTLIERNSKLGKKLLLTGNGKCNYTNVDFSNLDSIYNNDFAKYVYRKYDNNSFIKYFEDIGIVSKFETHRGIKYVYPNSNKSSSVVYNLLDKIVSNNVDIKYNSCVKAIQKKDRFFEVIIDSDEKLTFDKLVLACGGNSYQNTGSDGLGYNLSKSLGHKIISIYPALCALKYSDNDLKKVKGVRVDARLSCDTNNLQFEEIGEIQFTDFGISGVPILNLSRIISKHINDGNSACIYLDFFYNDEYSNYDEHIDNLVKKLKERKNSISYKSINDYLCGFLPDEINEVILKRSKVISNSIANLTENDIMQIAKNLVNFKINIIATANYDNAQITVGGVDTSEINQDTLESKIVKGLYFIGEVLDIDGKCGGYNLQLAYSTASIVADSIGG